MPIPWVNDVTYKLCVHHEVQSSLYFTVKTNHILQSIELNTNCENHNNMAAAPNTIHQTSSIQWCHKKKVKNLYIVLIFQIMLMINRMIYIPNYNTTPNTIQGMDAKM